MRFEPLSKASFGSDSPYFNTDAAIEVFNWYMQEDRDTANLVMSDIISKRVSDIADESGEEIYKAFDEIIDSRIALLKKSIANGVISKSMSDETVDATVEAVEIIKDWQENQHKRGWHGRFTNMGRSNMQYSFYDKSKPKESNQKQYDEAHSEAADALNFANGGKTDRNARVEANVHYTDRKGRQHTDYRTGNKEKHFIGSDSGQFFGGNKKSPNQRIDSIDWFGPDDVNLASDARDLLNMGSQVNDAKTVRPGESGATRNMRQLGAMSQSLDDMGVGALGGPKAKAALAAGKAVGELGPEAERYAGPSIRRLGYRYRGTEKTPDESMLRAAQSSMAGSNNKRGALLMLGQENKLYDMEDTTSGLERVQVPNKFIKYFESKLPNAKLINLQTESGAIAPSEGVIVSRDGKVVTQAVGYGDDHYLPFNMAKLARGKGGDYVRTRTLGGLTTEDIYAGMISGARSMTVVSHSGTFTLEFDPSFRGGRRMNDKARRMTTRYGKLVDSLASGTVRGDDIPSDRKWELEQQVLREVPGDTPDIRAIREEKLNNLKQHEADNPTPSQQLKDDWANEFGELTAQKYKTSDGAPMEWVDVKAQASNKEGRIIDSDEEAIKVLGLGPKYEKFMQSKERAYQREQSPYRLNGEGYRDAMMALKEQFPYFIKEVNWIPPNPQSTAKGRSDVGYVKPKHLRSANIKEGYHDPTIEGYMNSHGTGKRNADRENYSNRGAYERLEGKYNTGKGKKKQTWQDVQRERKRNFNAGGGSSTAGASTQGSAADVTRVTTSGITSGSFGPVYTGFTTSANLKNSKGLTDYDVLEQAMKVRSAMRSADRIPYVNPATGEQAAFNPFDNGLGQFSTTQFGVLFDHPNDDAAFKNSVIEGKHSLKELKNAMKALGSQTAGASGALANYLNGQNLLESPTPHNPKSASVLATDLANGLKQTYDFTRPGGADGMHYLPGLTKREYGAVWNSDTDIQSFVGSSQSRFGYDMSLNKHQNTFDKMSANIGKAANEALQVTNDWNRQIKAYGGVENVPNKSQVVSYGGKSYSIYGVKDLEKDVAADVLAVAKMTQLKRQYATHDESSKKPEFEEKMNVISLDQVQEESESANEFNADKDSNDRPVGDLKFGQQSDKRSGNVTTVPFSGDKAKLDKARENIHSMIGLDTVKSDFDDLIKESRINQYRESKGMKTAPTTKHLIFTGDPGTGKTTVAKELANAYSAMGLIPKDSVAVMSRADLVSPYQGQTAAKVRDAFKKNKGGVIFIDEAYSLVNGPDDSYGYEAVDELVNQIENNRADTVVILAGYPKEINQLMTANPGLKSRFPRTVHFPNYNARQLSEIGAKDLGSSEYNLDPSAQTKFNSATRKIAASPGMANGRDVRNLNDAVRRSHSRRISLIPRSELSAEDLRTVLPEDVESATKDYFKNRTASKG